MESELICHVLTIRHEDLGILRSSVSPKDDYREGIIPVRAMQR